MCLQAQWRKEYHEVTNINFYANESVSISTVTYSSPSSMDQVLLKNHLVYIYGHSYSLLNLNLRVFLLVPLNMKPEIISRVF